MGVPVQSALLGKIFVIVTLICCVAAVVSSTLRTTSWQLISEPYSCRYLPYINEIERCSQPYSITTIFVTKSGRVYECSNYNNVQNSLVHTISVRISPRIVDFVSNITFLHTIHTQSLISLIEQLLQQVIGLCNAVILRLRQFSFFIGYHSHFLGKFGNLEVCSF